ERLKPGRTIGFSAFYWLPHSLSGYGAMAYAKLEQERLAVKDPARYGMLRAGTFLSKATRGIALLLQRSIKGTEHAQLQELGARWKASGEKFKDFFFRF